VKEEEEPEIELKFPKNPRKVNKRIVKRYGEAHPNCQVCNGIASEVHHIVFKSHGGSDEDNNLISLCWMCHRKAHSVYNTGEILTKESLCIHKKWSAHQTIQHRFQNIRVKKKREKRNGTDE
jgi:hypothetical protein